MNKLSIIWCKTMKNLFSGHENKRIGMETVEKHTERITPKWHDDAFEILISFIENHSTFLAEDVRAYARIKGLREPSHPRAWGLIMVKAAKLGFIEAVGYAQVRNPNAHCANARVWRKM